MCRLAGGRGAGATRAGGAGGGDAAGGVSINRFEEHVVLRRLLDDLSVERRLAFVVTQVLGLSYEEAAQVCGCPIGTVRSRVSRAREDLVAALREHRGSASTGPSSPTASPTDGSASTAESGSTGGSAPGDTGRRFRSVG
jgi:hypothetical protein